jgi:hypothetical protein
MRVSTEPSAWGRLINSGHFEASAGEPELLHGPMHKETGSKEQHKQIGTGGAKKDECAGDRTQEILRKSGSDPDALTSRPHTHLIMYLLNSLTEGVFPLSAASRQLLVVAGSNGQSGGCGDSCIS